MRTRLVACVVACGALLVAGCGSSNDDSGGATTAPTPSSSTAGGDVAITIKDIKFNPKTVTVNAGQKITWTNEDGIAHNVTAKDGADFKSDNLSKGDTFEFAPTAAGTIKYACTIHRGQDGEITVQ